MKETEDDWKKWKYRTCSWIGRIKSVKMSILHEAIYGFNAIHISIFTEKKNPKICVEPQKMMNCQSNTVSVLLILIFKLCTFKDVSMHSVNIRHESNCSLLFVSYYWWSFSCTISHALTLLQSVTLLACSLDASLWMPAFVLYYYTCQSTEL